MKTMCPSCYHENDFIQTHGLGIELPERHCGDNRFFSIWVLFLSGKVHCFQDMKILIYINILI